MHNKLPVARRKKRSIHAHGRGVHVHHGGNFLIDIFFQQFLWTYKIKFKSLVGDHGGWVGQVLKGHGGWINEGRDIREGQRASALRHVHAANFSDHSKAGHLICGGWVVALALLCDPRLRIKASRVGA